MKLDVPYYSQYKDVLNEEMRSRSCAVTCLKMALDYISPGITPSIDRLIEETSFHIQSMKEHGLITEKAATFVMPHDVLVLMAHNYGVMAYREEFKSVTVGDDNHVTQSRFSDQMFENGLKKIVASLETGSVVAASILPGPSEGKSFHLILLIGFEHTNGTLTGFYYHDPDARDVPRNDQFITVAYFTQFWRKMAIFIG